MLWKPLSLFSLPASPASLSGLSITSTDIHSKVLTSDAVTLTAAAIGADCFCGDEATTTSVST